MWRGEDSDLQVPDLQSNMPTVFKNPAICVSDMKKLIKILTGERLCSSTIFCLAVPAVVRPMWSTASRISFPRVIDGLLGAKIMIWVNLPANKREVI